jgi:hypothetical protein
MVAWIARIVLIAAGLIAGWFVPATALNFPIFQMTIALLLVVLIIIALAFWRPGRRDKSEKSAKQESP